MSDKKMTEDFIKHVLEFMPSQEFDVKDLEVLHLNNDRVHYQRAPIESNVQKHVEQMSKESLDSWTGIVAQRADGSYWLLNGQHHSEAAIRLGYKKLRFYIIPSDGPQHETLIFGMFQKFQEKHKDD